MMASDQAQDSTSYLKLVKLHTVMMRGALDTKDFQRILEQEGDINYKLPNAGLMKLQGWKSIGSTILHLSYRHSCKENMQIFNLLLDHGADVTIKNAKERTVIHEAFDKILNIDWFSDLREDPCVSPVLSTHLRFNITANPVDPNGLSHFHAACVMNDVKVIELFLNNGVSVHQSVNVDSKIFAGYTPLHFASKFVCFEAVELLLRRGANTQAQDAQKMTPLHAIVNKSVAVSKTLSYGRWTDRKLDNCIDVVERMVEKARDINAQDHLGFSYLHFLCIFKDSSMLERHLNDIDDANRAVNADSPLCPGFTPLHFAAMFNLDSVKLLLAKGADIASKDANEKTPLDLCIARYDIEVIHDILARSTCKDVTLSDGKTKLTDLVISLRNSYGVVNACIHSDSSLWPGYSTLHVATIFLEMCSRDDDKKRETLHNLVERCLRNGTDVSGKGVLDQTPLQFAFRRYRVKVVDMMLKYHRGSSNVVDADGLSHLHIACAAKNKNVVKALLHHGADINCRLGSNAKWYVTREHGMITSTTPVFFCPGSTPLHIAVATGDLEMAKLLLRLGADLQAQDANGMSPVHRLMTSYDNRMLFDELLSSENLHECVAESYGLSHLHIACYFNHSNAVKKLLLEPESQVNRAFFCNTTSESLFDYQPGLCYIDRYGDPSVDPLSVLVPFDGFAPLRVAMKQYRNSEITELLLQQGADVLAGNARSLVPLYKAMSHHCRDWSLFAALIKSDETLRRRVFERITGLTDLHLACFECDLPRVDELIVGGANVDARIRDDSPIWSGQTPLHVLMKKIQVADESDAILKLLLDKGADVSISDGRYTPLHMIDPKKFCPSPDRDASCLNRIVEGPCPDRERYYSQKWQDYSFTLASLMVKSIKDFSSNPANDQGVSHFHIACGCLDVAAVEGFLKHGVDVNARVDYFSKVYGGYTPLHVTLTRDANSPHKRKIVELLLKHGADVHAESYNGNTPLHYAAMYYKCVGRQIFEMIFDAGANINAKNIKGASPLEMLSKKWHATFSNISYFIKRNCRINDFNSTTDEGLMAMIIESVNKRQKKIKKLLLTSPDIAGVDEMGRSAIHNVVSTRSLWISEKNYIELIEKLEKLGCDVDYQDKSGQTALHAAARFQNDRAVSALLVAGSDINITDATGRTAFDYSLIPRKQYNCDRDTLDDIFNGDAIKLFATHVNKLRLARLHVNALNGNSKEIAHKKHYRYIDVMMGERRFRAILQSLDNAKVGCQSLSLRDFMSENGAMWMYSKMRRMDREHVVKLFDTILSERYEEKLSELKCLVKLQFRNYLARSKLVEDAKIALDTLANMTMPDLCSKAIFARFENWELRNVVVSAS